MRTMRMILLALTLEFLATLGFAQDPAEKAGLQEGSIVIGSGRDRVLLGGDVITHVDGIPVDEWKREPFKNAREGESHEIVFRVIRRGEIVELKTATVHRSHW